MSLARVLVVSSLFIAACMFIAACDSAPGPEDGPSAPVPGVDVVFLPVVVHVLHNGESVGEGPNLAESFIRRQVEILNEDFRRREGTRGYNDHPVGADARIEFVLARREPDGEPSTGINRIDVSTRHVQNLGYNQNHFAQYAYWDPAAYINVWTTPLSEASACIALGAATGPVVDLPGIDRLTLPGPGDAEGILVHWMHVGERDVDCHARHGRTLTHEMGHYLGLLHTWGDGNCETNDFCDDTPAVDAAVFGSTPYLGCAGDTVMIGNYMNYSDDAVMNIFTRDQVARMHYVLSRHPGRNALVTSPTL